MSPVEMNNLRRLTGSGTISDDHPCPGCGYNLIGLPRNGLCPECARPIRSYSRTAWATCQMIDAPMDYLHRFAIGAVLLCFSGIPLFVLVILMLFSAVGARFNPLGAHYLVDVAAMVVAAAWFAGVLLITVRPPYAGEETPSRETQADKALRAASRATQPLWFLGVVAVAGTGLLVNFPGATAAMLLGVLAFAAAWFGLVPLLLVMSDRAFWASDTGLANMLRSATWCVVLTGIGFAAVFLAGVIQLFSVAIGTALAPLVLVAAIALVGVLVLVGGFIGLILARFALLALWSIRNRLSADERDRRRREKVEREEDEARRRAARAGAAHPSPTGAYTPAPAATRLAARDGRIVPLARPDTDPYRLAGE